MQGLNKLEKQFLDFPFGDHDDIIDMLAQARIVFNQTEPTRNRGVVEVSNDEYLM
jgi:phage terminase large subunit-like protein